jgi:Uma2 family endonuclease
MPELQRLRMSYDEWLALPEKPKAEWVDGEVVVNSPPAPDHANAQYRLERLLDDTLSGVRTYREVGVQLPRNRVRIPDVMVVPGRPEGFIATETPLLVVEVLSPSTRTEDTIRKAAEYAGAGIGQYWLLDQQLRTLTVLRNVDGAWEELLRLDEAHPTGEVTVADHGTVPVDLRPLLGG